MKKLLSRLALLGCGLLSLGQAHAGYTPTIDFWECANKVGGTFTHGRVPSGCDVASFGPDSFVRGNYGQAIFNDASYNTANANDPISVAERKRYMQEMYPIIRDASERYLKARKPGVLPDELAAYQRGVFALLRQESFWSHYRDAQLATGQPFLLKMVRGDNGHGHGMMQLDDRYHLVPLQEGKGWNMLQNFTYAIDIYYDGWQKAPASCLGGVTTGTGTQAQIDEYWRSRARSAWSAYNGGPTKVCRWQNAADVNVAKDNGYRDNYDLRRWLPDVTDLAKAATVDVNCLMDMGASCPLPTSGGPLPNTLMKLGSAACVLVGETLECVDDMRDAACLGSRTSFDDSVATTVYAAAVSGRTRVDHNRHQLCRAGTPGLQSLGSAIATSGPLELRTAVGGMALGTLPAGNYQVLDFEVRGVLKQDHYYRVRGALTTGAQQDGWILAGDSASHAGIAAAAAPTAAGAIAYPGDWVAVNVTTSLNLRASPPSGTVVTTMPRGAVVQVKEVFGTASANNLYYRTEYLGKDGWFFAGNLYPTSSLASWAIPAAAPASPTKHAHCPAGTRYDIHSRQCMSASSVYGPFTASATQACLDNGAGAACTAGRAVVVDGSMLQLQLWNKAVNAAAVGNGDCPRGASRSVAHRFHCTEAVVRNGAAETDVYGPFGTTLVNACLAANGNAAFCRSNRWPGSVYTALQP